MTEATSADQSMLKRQEMAASHSMNTQHLYTYSLLIVMPFLIITVTTLLLIATIISKERAMWTLDNEYGEKWRATAESGTDIKRSLIQQFIWLGIIITLTSVCSPAGDSPAFLNSYIYAAQTGTGTKDMFGGGTKSAILVTLKLA